MKQHMQAILTSVGIFSFVFFIASFFARIGVDPHHDGIMFKAAYDVAMGKVLFRDTYSHYGPVAPLIQALAVVFFGKYLLGIRMVTAFFYGLIGVVLWLSWSKLLGKLLS